MARHIRSGDNVIVTSGRDKGRTGKVLRVLVNRENDNGHKVVVQGVNVRVKHIKPTQDNPQGGTVEREMPIHISNISPVVDGKPTRVRFHTKDDGSKVRVAARNGDQIGPALRKARS